MEKLNRKLIRKLIIEEAQTIRHQRLAESKIKIKLLNNCILQENKMLDMGYSKKEVKTRLLKEFLGMDALGDTFKQAGIAFIADKIGVNIDSFIGSVIVNTIENISYEEFMDFLSGEGSRCDIVLENIASGILEALGEQIMESFTGTGQSETGMIVGTFQEIINNFISQNSYSTMIKDGLRDAICGMSLSDIIGFGTGSTSSATDNFDLTEPMEAMNQIGSFFDFSE
tara:strand:+ start:919 stop:1599 length:681 start_codon:yes stop_codon:yes gene_type:complete